MTAVTEVENEQAATAAPHVADRVESDVVERIPPRQRAIHWLGRGFDPTGESHITDRSRGDHAGRQVLVMFCYEPPSSVVGRAAARLAAALVREKIPVHIFSREPFEGLHPAVETHAVGPCQSCTLLGSVDEFTRRACNAFLREYYASCSTVTLMGHDWSAIPSISLLHGIKNTGAILSLTSLERQRSGLTSELSRRIDEIEQTGLREANAVLVYDTKVAELARACTPDCMERIVCVRGPAIPAAHFDRSIDAGEIKARFQIGPVDPMLLYIGDLDEAYGPDLLMRAMPSILKQDHHARAVLVGDGELLWPLRVYSRYLELDHAVRLIGHLEGDPLYDLIQASDVVVVPSRRPTPWWPIEVAWAARRPVLATPDAASELLNHGVNSFLMDPSVDGCAEGVERLLADDALRETIRQGGKMSFDERYGDYVQAEKVKALMTACAPEHAAVF